MRLLPLSLLLAASSGSLAAILTRVRTSPIGLSLGVVPLTGTLGAGGPPPGFDPSGGTIIAIGLAVLAFPAVVSVAIGGLEQLNDRRRARTSAPPPPPPEEN